VLNALATFAPGARSATISLDVRPPMSPGDKGSILATRFVVSVRVFPFQSPTENSTFNDASLIAIEVATRQAS